MSTCEKKAAATQLSDRDSPAANEHFRPAQPSMNATHQIIECSMKRIQQQDYAGAAGLLQTAGYDEEVRNLLGVCLMRLGHYEKAVELYRQLVLKPDSVLERSELRESYKRNFATALLLRGLPSGTLEVLAAMHDSESLRAVQLRSAIVQWEGNLSMLRWLDWKLNWIEPPNCKVPIDFEPGEIEFPITQHHPEGPARSSVHLAA